MPSEVKKVNDDWDCQRKQPPEHIWIEKSHLKSNIIGCKDTKIILSLHAELLENYG
jgi:hypothetical protein